MTLLFDLPAISMAMCQLWIAQFDADNSVIMRRCVGFKAFRLCQDVLSLRSNIWEHITTILATKRALTFLRNCYKACDIAR